MMLMLFRNKKDSQIHKSVKRDIFSPELKIGAYFLGWSLFAEQGKVNCPISHGFCGQLAGLLKK